MGKLNELSLFIIFLYVQEIRSKVYDGFLETKNIGLKPQLKSGYTKNSIFFNVEEEKFDDNELRKLFVKNFKLYEAFLKEKKEHAMDNLAKTRLSDPHSRKTRNINMSISNPPECYTCEGTKTENLDCYGAATSFPTITCAGLEICFTELHPNYIRRGCALRDKIKRTFVCKCPLCNDKPSYNHSYFSYRTESEWEYGNSVIMEEGDGAELLCKFCKTKGVDTSADASCREGKKAKFKKCNKNEICYTNIDDLSNFVSRGCIERPVYNSLFTFCGVTLCNHQRHIRPDRKLDRDVIMNLILTNMNTSQLQLKNKVAYRERQSVVTFLLLLFHILIKIW